MKLVFNDISELKIFLHEMESVYKESAKKPLSDGADKREFDRLKKEVREHKEERLKNKPSILESSENYPNRKIERIHRDFYVVYEGATPKAIDREKETLVNKINEIIDALNHLRSEKYLRDTEDWYKDHGK